MKFEPKCLGTAFQYATSIQVPVNEFPSCVLMYALTVSISAAPLVKVSYSTRPVSLRSMSLQNGATTLSRELDVKALALYTSYMLPKERMPLLLIYRGE